jgi:hypothetical protein
MAAKASRRSCGDIWLIGGRADVMEKLMAAAQAETSTRWPCPGGGGGGDDVADATGAGCGGRG